MYDVEKAVNEYISRRDRKTHPDGKFDNARRWYPSEAETADCCKFIRSPSRSWPYSLLHHCRTLQHICNKYGVDVKQAKKLLREIEKPVRLTPFTGYKAVANKEGVLLSIFDGVTEYQIGVKQTQKVGIDHNGGFYVYRSLEKAKRAVFPSNSCYDKDDLPDNVVITYIEVYCEGQYTEYENGKISVSSLTPIKLCY